MTGEGSGLEWKTARVEEKEKTPVFIGLGAVYNRNLNTLFREPGSLIFLRIGFNNFHGLCSSDRKNPSKPLM